MGEAVLCGVLGCIRLVEDGYVSYDGSVLEVGLLRDLGGWVRKDVYEDGTIYVYNTTVDGNGISRWPGPGDGRALAVAAISLLTLGENSVSWI